MASLPPRIPTSHGFPNVTYKPLDLDSKKPLIRLAILQPASREVKIRMTFKYATFLEKPEYEALSYTWGEPGVLKAIELNGSSVNIQENLWSALVSLRDARKERLLWIDAICINQADVIEKNQQVRRMEFIFHRAKKVIVWLGITESIYTFEEDDGLTDSYVVTELFKRPYWKRVWIVQEVCVARQLQVYWGEESEPWDSFFKDMAGLCRMDEISPAMKLFEQRREYLSGRLYLANLMEAFQESLCKEPRDRVYGFVGIAHDCQDGSFPIDYSKLLFELYNDVVQFQLRSAKINAKTTIHFSQLVQRLLGGSKAILEDFLMTRPGQSIPLSAPDPIKQESDILKVTAVSVGKISIVGPSYDDFVGTYEAPRAWNVAISQCQADLGKLRKKNNCLLELNNADLDTIHPIDPQYSWRRPRDRDNMNTSEWELIPMFKFGPESEQVEVCSSQQPHLFATDRGDIGLMPHNARKGDSIFQFWNSDVVAVVRLDGSYHLRLIGRAMIANDEYESSCKFHVPTGSDADLENGFKSELYVDIRTMQLLTE